MKLLEKEQGQKLFEKVLKANERYYTNFREFILLNRNKGRDYHVLLDYLECRDRELEGTSSKKVELYDFLKAHRFNYLFYDSVFNHLERKTLDRIGVV